MDNTYNWIIQPHLLEWNLKRIKKVTLINQLYKMCTWWRHVLMLGQCWISHSIHFILRNVKELKQQMSAMTRTRWWCCVSCQRNVSLFEGKKVQDLNTVDWQHFTYLCLICNVSVFWFLLTVCCRQIQSQHFTH